jgi:biotin carboxyl carrier protein
MGTAMKLRETSDAREFAIEVVERDDSSLRVRIDGREIQAQYSPITGGFILTIDGRRIRVAAARIGERTFVAAGCASFDFVPIAEGRAVRGRGLVTPTVTAPMPGKVLKVMVAEGDLVAAGQPLVVLEAMKMETTLSAESAAIVRRVAVSAGAMVDHGAILLELTPAPAPSFPAADGRAS